MARDGWRSDRIRRSCAHRALNLTPNERGIPRPPGSERADHGSRPEGSNRPKMASSELNVYPQVYPCGYSFQKVLSKFLF